MLNVPKANPEKIVSLVDDAYETKLLVPTFQRSFVWDPEGIREFIASILQGYFVGTFLVLDMSMQQPLFETRSIEGRDELVGSPGDPTRHAVTTLVLDGQQRITSLFYALHAPPIPLKGRRNAYRFYVDLDRVVAGQLDDAVKSVSMKDADARSDAERLVASNKWLPIGGLRDPSRFYAWLYNGQQVWTSAADKEKIAQLHQRIADFMVPVVRLPANSTLDYIVNCFERINRTGDPLSMFDLCVARLFTKKVNLTDLPVGEQIEGIDAEIAA